MDAASDQQHTRYSAETPRQVASLVPHHNASRRLCTDHPRPHIGSGVACSLDGAGVRTPFGLDEEEITMAGVFQRRPRWMHAVRARARALTRSRVLVSASVLVCALAFVSASGVPSAGGATSGGGAFPPRDTASSDGAAVGARWTWPVLPAVLERPFEAPATAYAAGHRGIDPSAPAGAGASPPPHAPGRVVGVVVHPAGPPPHPCAPG